MKELQLLMVVEGGPSVKIYKAGPHRVGEIEPAIAIKKYLIESTSRSVRLRQTGEKLDGYGAGTEGRAVSSGRGFEMRDKEKFMVQHQAVHRATQQSNTTFYDSVGKCYL